MVGFLNSWILFLTNSSAKLGVGDLPDILRLKTLNILKLQNIKENVFTNFLQIFYKFQYFVTNYRKPKTVAKLGFYCSAIMTKNNLKSKLNLI
jgi:hypothetical protein